MKWMLILLLIPVFFYFYTKKKNNNKKVDFGYSNEIIPNTDYEVSPINEEFLALMPKIEFLPTEINLDEKPVHEILDGNVVAKLDALVPQIVQNFTNHVKNKPIEELLNKVKEGNIYQVVIPPEAKLYDSKEVLGAFRGGYTINNKLAGQANLIPMDVENLTAISNTVADVMNISSMVVGQYYMAQIDTKMAEMQEGIDKIYDFQQTEFKARIIALIGKVGNISKFNIEIIENDELRKRSLDDLNRYRDDAVELLQQVNLTIENIVSKGHNSEFNKYQESIDDLDRLIRFQQYLLSILEEIGRLIYLLNKGTVSSDHCYSLYNIYIEQSTDARNLLNQWHDESIKTFALDLDNKRYAKQGWEGLLFEIPGMIINDWKYNEIPDSVITQIYKQLDNSLEIKNTTENLLEKETKIISKDGKYYYLTE
ncbi:hypothetical protein O3643_04970 [Streptococcus sp. 20925_1_44]|uniref:hypothetical protein n=1 Tax=Streptococcus sp. 20925_1_44 TaxID=3003666 RepID=UPI00352D2C69